MFENISQRHEQFQNQAEWTASIRPFLMQRSGIQAGHRCLEVGCGTGVVLQEWAKNLPAAYGIDTHFDSLRFALDQGNSKLAAASAAFLPFEAESFDCIFSHYFFLWLASPIAVLSELRRCLKPGGVCLIFAEPDYGGRLDYPEEFESIRPIQMAALSKAGADPCIGRKLRGLLKQSGFQSIYGGILGSEWNEEDPYLDAVQKLDTQNLLLDMAQNQASNNETPLEQAEQRAKKEGSRMIFVPTFFFCAKKPSI